LWVGQLAFAGGGVAVVEADGGSGEECLDDVFGVLWVFADLRHG